ncbi:insecticidal toxin complex protein TccC [Pseudomonas migulae]|uniref:RHS repeat domain-containing protein n=1 Tax=Pseudomonas migulae TaxID=78543 RepID=UPI00209E758B|nr:RHS repeat-associated core domain-containing protein [Pseudomonas migulae]MCP1499763.1 insecticidal toxin complex protein TccC [Pseudomonas migulae]
MKIQLQVTHRHTPKLIAIEPRDLVVRSMDYYRAGSGDNAEAQVNHTAHDPAGRAIAQRDPRLFVDASAPANVSTIHGLSGTAVCTVSVDAGLRVSLFGEAGQPVHSWDGRGAQRWMHYDNQQRLTALFEQTAEGEAVCAERLSYATNDPAFADHNQCGRLISHEDAAGMLLFNDYGLTGAALEQERRIGDIAQSFSTHSRLNPLGDLLSRTDAQGNEQRVSQTVGGHLCAVDLRLNNTLEWLPMVSSIAYNAHLQVEREVAGNGVITSLKYTAEDGRLQRLVSRLGQNEPLQDLRYTYDPVGNVLSIEDAALPIRYFANQRIEPVSHYWYDTLYRLIEATGWEAGSVNHGPSSSATTADPATPGNYRQTYRYDAGNNLLELTHFGPQNHGHRLIAAAHSNRCLPVRDGIEPGEDDFRNGFDANGNLLKLGPGQTLSWDLRNQLREVRPVERDTGPDDYERYDYGADGMRVRKVRSLQTNAQTVVIETRYLPGLEIRTHSGTGEVLHVIEVATGRGNVRVLHWEAGKPNGITNNQQRYSLTDHLGSSTLELDQDASIITQERYYPFGGTAWSNGEAVQVSYKTARYSGKELDATGLYYYGFRYYVSWLQRWCNSDPAGQIDGLNLYSMVNNCPLVLKDNAGLVGGGTAESSYFKERGIDVLKRGAKEIGKTYPKIEEGISAGIAGSKEFVAVAINKLQDPAQVEFVGSILKDYFGNTPESEVDVREAALATVEVLKVLGEGVEHHLMTAGEDIFMVDFSQSGPVFTFQGDPRIYITSQVNDRASGAFFSRVINHESSHSYNNTDDIWSYKNQRMASTGLKHYQDLERLEAVKVAKDPLSAGSRLNVGLLIGAIDGIGAVADIMVQGVEPVLSASLEKYKTDASLRIKVNLLNASSVESLIHALNVNEVQKRYFGF